MPLAFTESPSYAYRSLSQSEHATGHPWHGRVPDSPPGTILFGSDNKSTDAKINNEEGVGSALERLGYTY